MPRCAPVGGQWRTARAFALSCAFSWFCARARAEQWPEPSRASLALVIDYVGVADPELPAAARELLGRIDVHVASRFEAVAGEVLAYARIEANGPVVEVVLEDPQTHAPRAQRSVPRAESPALLRETVAHVLLGLVEPLAEAARNPPPAPPLPSEAAQKPSTAAAPGVGLGLSGGPVLLAPQHWGARFFAHVALAWNARLSPQLAFDLGSALPITLRASDVRARFWLPGSRLRARVTPLEGRHAALDAALSAGADVMLLRPTSVDGNIEIGPPSKRVRVQPVFGATLTCRARLSARLALVFGLGTDVDPLPRTWLVDINGTKTTLLRTAWFRPYAVLGLDWSSRALLRGGAR